MAEFTSDDGSYMPVTPTTVKMLYVPADGDPELRDVPRTVAALQALVGGHFELIAVQGSVAYVNDDGRRLNLPINVVASALLRALGLLAGAVRGPAVFAGPADDDGDDTDISQHVLELVARP